MSEPAVIQPVAQVAGDFRDAAPGHRFNLYFPIWRDGWSLDKSGKAAALKECTRIPERVGRLLAGVRSRQRALIQAYRDAVHVEAISSAPFATGLGNEHPVENGFAFLTPYGLPYLAGSGVKGVLRRAAEELALFPEEYPAGGPESVRPTILDVWWLFGFEGAAGAWWPLTRKEERELSAEQKDGRARWRSLFTQHVAALADRPDLPLFIRAAFPNAKDHARYLADPALFLRDLDNRRQEIRTRGVLDFWDVFPQPPKKGPYADRLAVEIMTPHFGDYYQRKTSPIYPNGATPHDAGQPNPIPFLAVPADSAFDFYVVCHSGRLPSALLGQWRLMLAGTFAHAFEWLGFGAKTAVGYGQMEVVPTAPGAGAARPGSGGQANRSTPAPGTARASRWDNVTVTLNPGNGELTVTHRQSIARAGRKQAAELLQSLPPDLGDRLLKKRKLDLVAAEVLPEGNAWRVVRLLTSR